MKILYNSILLLLAVGAFAQKPGVLMDPAGIEEYLLEPPGRKKTGMVFPDIKGTDSNGKTFSSRNTKRIAVYNFWREGCISCIAEIPMLMQLKEKYSNKVDFIGITYEDRQTVKSITDKHKFNYRQVPLSREDIDGLTIASDQTIVIVCNGEIVYCKHGGNTPDSENFAIIQEKELKVYSEVIEKYLKEK